MREIVRLLLQIALLKRGPQDLPVSRTLLALTACAYAGLTALVSGLLPPPDSTAPRTAVSPLPLAVEIAFTLAWYVVVLALLGRRERFLQTTSAVFGVQTLLMQPLLLSVWLMRRYGQDATWQLPIAVAGLAVVIWLIAANSHIVKAALEWSSAASVALVILQIVSGQLLLFTLFPPVPG